MLGGGREVVVELACREHVVVGRGRERELGSEASAGRARPTLSVEHAVKARAFEYNAARAGRDRIARETGDDRFTPRKN